MSSLKIDTAAVRQLAEILNDTHLTEIEYNNSDTTIRVAREVHIQQGTPVTAYAPPMPMPAAQPGVAAPQQSVSTTPASTDWSTHAGVVKSPMVGTVYMASEPGAAPFIKLNDTVKEGQALIIIEAMKVMNPIKAPKSGRIAHIFIQDAMPIEFGEPIVVIE